MFRWHENYLGLGLSHGEEHYIAATHRDHPHEHIYKRFLTVGPMRYGMRVGAVSPPPPGVGPRYRSHQSCWPTTPCGDSVCDNVPVSVSQIPLLTPPINSLDIISCANRMRINEDATSNKLLAQQASATVRDHVLYGNKCSLKTQLKRCALVRPQVYTRLGAYGEIDEIKEDNTLDRLPRFRFGGNRTSAAEKRNNDHHRYKELTDRLKRGTTPVPPPRTRHTSKITPPLSPSSTVESPEPSERHIPLRSASFSQVDYCPDDNKYVRRRPSTHQEQEGEISTVKEVSTLPRPKNASRPTTPTKQELPVFNIDCSSEDIKTLNVLTENSRVPDVEITPGSPEKPTARLQENSTSSQDKRKDKSRRRKGIYLSQWPNAYQSTEDVIPQFVQDGDFPCANSTSKFIQESLVEISKLSNTDDKNREFPIWSSPQEEPLSPEDNTLPPEWPAVSKSRLLSQSPDEKDSLKVTPRSINLFRSDSLSEGEPDLNKSDQISLVTSDLSDNESRLSLNADTTSPNVPRRYSKRPLRGPYGQMLEAEMKKPECRKNLNSDLKFLEDLSTCTSLNNLSKTKHTRTRGAGNCSLDETNVKDKINNNSNSISPKQVNKRKVSADNLIVPNEIIDTKFVVNHQRTTSSPSKLEGFTNAEVSSELLEQLLRGSSEQLSTSEANHQIQKDTRTHVVFELYENEKYYVESLRIVVTKYLEPLKTPENAHLLDANLVDEIFYQIPFLYNHHQVFLTELNERLELWDIKQKIGDVFLEMFSKTAVIDSYTNYVNNWKRARETLKNAQQSKPAFSRFLEVTSRQHTGKLALDSLLIKPIQKFPKYELLLQRLIKHTDENHPDHSLLLAAQRQIHELLLKINCTEKEALELEQLREIEGLIDGLIDLAIPERQYLRHDSVTMSHGGGPRKERALFLFSDLLLITGIKRRSGTIRRPTISGQGSVTSTLEANKYKLLMKLPLEEIEINKSKDDNLKQIMIELDNLSEDISILNQINELAWSLHYNHSNLDECIKEMLTSLNKQLTEQQNSDSQLSCLDLTINTANGPENVSIIFSKSEKRTSWEESFSEAKHKLVTSGDRRPLPELVATVPIRKTRAGLQFTCAAPTLCENSQDVWVCNSDGYVGQVCVLSLAQEPNVTSCNGVCNARILCIASVPGINRTSLDGEMKVRVDVEEHTQIHFDSSSSSDEDDNCDNEINEEPQKLQDSDICSVDNDETDNQQSTMWLGTEDGAIHIYNCSDNIRIKKNKVKLQLGASILCIIYLDNRVYASLANGDIVIYFRDSFGAWDTNSPATYTIGCPIAPVAKMVPCNGKLWCACGSTIKIIDVQTLAIENIFPAHNDNNKSITFLVLSGNGVWLSIQNSAILKCYHVLSFDLLYEVNVAPSVTKMLASCDDIIRQHKAACLRVTALVTAKDLLWVGTSAGVVLNMPLPHISTTTTKLVTVPNVNGVPHGHTGIVRFLTTVELPSAVGETSQRNSFKTKQESRTNMKVLVISGGDGYEDFRTSNLSEVAGREDSTNHLLLWDI